MKRDKILGILHDHAEELSRFGVSSIAVFGSAARDEHGPKSDVDILVEFNPQRRIGLLAFIRLRQRLEEMIGVRVDLATKKALKPQLRDRILREAVYAD
jgi:hypothetical protein